MVLAGCTTTRESGPARTATEQLLLSTAVDHALAGLRLAVPDGTKIWVDAEYFDSYDLKYAVGAIRDHLLHQGARLMPDRGGADVVVEVRAGALSTNSDAMLIGIPSMALPVPFVGTTQTPELALVKRQRDDGIAKIGLTAYDARTGALVPFSPAAPSYGFSKNTRWSLFSLFDWKHSDILPPGAPE